MWWNFAVPAILAAFLGVFTNNDFQSRASSDAPPVQESPSPGESLLGDVLEPPGKP